MTGHQEFIGTPNFIVRRAGDHSKTEKNKLDPVAFLKGLGIKNLTITGAYNIEKLERIFSKEISKSGTKVIIIDEECALEKDRRQKREKKPERKAEIYYTITDDCVKCNECIEALGCTAINAVPTESESNEDQIPTGVNLQYYIDESRCVPKICPGMCKAVCPNSSIKKTIINPESL